MTVNKADNQKNREELQQELVRCRKRIKQLEKRLDQEEPSLILTDQRFRRLYEGSQDGWAAVNMEGTIIAFNRSFREMLGYEDAEIYRLSYSEITPEKWHKKEELIIQEQVLPRGYSDVFEKEYRRKDGTIIPVELRIYLEEDENGRPSSMWAFVRDISERKKAEEQIRESQARFKQLAENIEDFFWLSEWPSKKVLYACPAFETMWGFSREALLADETFWLKCIHPEDRDYVEDKYNWEATTGTFDIEYRIIRPDGAVRWVHDRGFPVEDENGEVYRIAGIVEDITEKKNFFIQLQSANEQLAASEQQLRAANQQLHAGEQQLRAANEQLIQEKHRLYESEKKYRTLFESMLEGMVLHEIVYDQEGRAVDYRILDVNPSFERLTGLSPESVRGALASRIYQTGEAPYLDTYAQVVATGEPVEFDTYFAPMNKHFHISVFCLDGDKFATLFFDITRRRNAEMELEAANQQLRAGEQQLRASNQQLMATEQQLRAANNQLSENQRYLSTLMSNLPGTVYRCLIDRDWTMEYLSNGVIDLTGYHPDELQGNRVVSFADLIVPEDRERVWNETLDRMERDGPFQYEYRIRTRRGEVKWVWERGTGVYDDAGRLVALEGFIADITAAKQAETALLESEQRYRNLVEFSPISILVHCDDTIVYANPKAVEVLGASAASELIGKPALSIVHPDSMEKAGIRIEKIYNKRQVAELDEQKFIRLDGRVIDTEIMSTPIDYHGKPASQVAFVDITDRKKTERDLQEREATLKSLLQAVPVGIGSVSYPNRILGWVNQKLCEMTGKSEDDLKGMEARDLYPSHQEYEKVGKNIYPDVQEKGYSTIETSFKRKNGQITDIMLSLASIDPNDIKAGLVFTAMDITEKKKAERDIKYYQQQLKSLNAELARTEEKERRQIATDLHDNIGQMLVLAKMNIQMIQRTDPPPHPEQQKLIEQIIGEIDEAIEYVHSLLYRLSTPILFELGLEAALEWQLEQIAQRYDLRYRFNKDDKPKPLDDDVSSTLFQAGKELINNVVKHSQAERIEVDVRRVKGSIHITVSDNGIGFQSSKSSELRSGGFGLFNISERLDSLGGKLDISSERGSGTTISLIAPLKEQGRGD